MCLTDVKPVQQLWKRSRNNESAGLEKAAVLLWFLHWLTAPVFRLLCRLRVESSFLCRFVSSEIWSKKQKRYNSSCVFLFTLSQTHSLLPVLSDRSWCIWLSAEVILTWSCFTGSVWTKNKKNLILFVSCRWMFEVFSSVLLYTPPALALNVEQNLCKCFKQPDVCSLSQIITFQVGSSR